MITSERWLLLQYNGPHIPEGISPILEPLSTKFVKVTMEFAADTQVNQPQNENPTAFSLTNLTQEQRDYLISTIIYVDIPKCFDWIPPSAIVEETYFFSQAGMVNYSVFYESLSEQAHPKVPNVSNLRTGDIVKMTDYRGVGSFYVVWLSPNLVPAQLASPALDRGLLALPDYDNDSMLKGPGINFDCYGLTDVQWQLVYQKLLNFGWRQDETFRTQFPQLLADCQTNWALIFALNKAAEKWRRKSEDAWEPTVAPRHADGAHNDGLHHCYFIKHPDEMGYAAPSAFSSAGNGYFEREYASAVIDPLLTHSQSILGSLIQKCKKQPQWANNPLFPLDYFGDLDCGSRSNVVRADMIEWVEAQAHQMFCCHPTLMTDIRHAYSKHFEHESSNLYVLK
jgi:hypothetical protein